MDGTLDAIRVTYKFIDGAHFFVPADKKALGLCVANADLEVAYNEVGEQLSKLASFKSDSNIHFVPAIPFDEFKKIITAYNAVTELAGEYEIVPNPTQPWINTMPHSEDTEVA